MVKTKHVVFLSWCCLCFFFCSFVHFILLQLKEAAELLCTLTPLVVTLSTPPFPPAPPLCPAPPTLPAVTSSGLSFLGKLNRAATAALASPGLISHKNHVLNFLPLSSHSGPLSANCTFLFPLSFWTECGRFGSESTREHNRFGAVASKLRWFYYWVGFCCSWQTLIPGS